MQENELLRCQVEYLLHVRNLKEFFHHHARTETDQLLIHLLNLHQNQFNDQHRHRRLHNEHRLRHLLYEPHHNMFQGCLQPFPSIPSLLKLDGPE
jgi:hypothetical protein